MANASETTATAETRNYDETAEAALRGERLEPTPRKGRGRYGTQNLFVLAAQTVGWAIVLTAIDRSPHIALTIPLVIFFCFLMQGVFSMMHDFFHTIAHRNMRMNYLIGWWGSTLFITSATLHQVQHWGHHVRNRSVSEQGEFVHEGESPIGKFFLYYFATWGGLWLSGIFFPLVSVFLPYSVAKKLTSMKKFNTYSAAFGQFKQAHWTRMRIEAVLLLMFWTLVIAYGPWQLSTLAIAYIAFAFSWSSLQWVYHLRTPIDVIEGAYNLRMPTVGRWLFLNFNCNLTHHRYPHLPWQELYKATNQEETQPLWYRWLLMFKPPRRKPNDLSFLEKRYF